MKLDILAFGAHPDDVELGAGGTIAKEISIGKKVGIIDLTRGELGSRGTVNDRDHESAESSRLLGIEFRANLGFRDGFFVNDELHQLQVIPYLRRYKPEIVICNAFRDRHIDHRKGSSLVSNACFLSGLRQIKTNWEGQDQDPWRPKAVYHYIQDYHITPDFVVDISEFMDKKMAVIKAYKSQFFDPASSQPQTPISSKEFLDFLFGRAIEFGRPAGFKFAEGFTVERLIGVDSLSDLT